MTAPPVLKSPLLDLIDGSFDLRARTRALYHECVDHFVTFMGHGDPALYTPADVSRWILHLLETRQPQTVVVFRKAIRYASKQWVNHAARGEDREDFTAKVNKIKTQKQPPREPMTYEEAHKLLATCESTDETKPRDRLLNRRDRLLLILALRSGLRRHGLASVNLERIRPPKITADQKGGGEITFEADDETLAELATWTHVLHRSGFKKGQIFRHITKDGAIGKPMTEFQIWYVFRKRAREAKIRDVFPHLARHTTVTWLREAGRSSAEVSKLTGQTERTIENIYTHVRTSGAVGNVLPSLLPAKPEHDPEG